MPGSCILIHKTNYSGHERLHDFVLMFSLSYSICHSSEDHLAIPFEKLVGGMYGISFSDHPAVIFHFFSGVPRNDLFPINAMQKTAHQTTRQ